MADSSPQQGQGPGMLLTATDKKTGQTTSQFIPTRQISKEEFGLAPAVGEDNDTYARQYNTD